MFNSMINSSWFKGFLVLLSVLSSEEAKRSWRRKTKFCHRTGNRIIHLPNIWEMGARISMAYC